MANLSLAYFSEKCEPFYDEFIEKQLLAGNIPSRQISITLLSFSATLPTADHGRMLSGPSQVHTSNSSAELHAVSSQVSLQSIQDVSNVFLRIDIVANGLLMCGIPYYVVQHCRDER